MSLSVLSVVGIAARLLVAVLPTAVAQSTTAQCLTSFNWMFNSRNQSPCLVAAYAQGACTGGGFTVDSLPLGSEYTGPYVAQATPCYCSTVVYSLVSACGVCQNRSVEAWSSWHFNCTQVYTSQYPVQIPSGTAIPGWAYLDVVTSDNFNPAMAQADTLAPESTGVAVTTGAVTNTAASTVSPFSTPFSTSTAGANGGGTGSTVTSKKSNAGAIAGGVVGGVVGLALIAGVVTFFFMRSRRDKAAPSTAYYNEGLHSAAPLNTPPPMSQPSYNQTSRLYDPADPSTYPQVPQTPTIHTTNSGPGPQPYAHQPQAYSGIPEL